MKSKEQVLGCISGLKLGYQENEREYKEYPEQFDAESFFSVQNANLEKIKILEWVLE